MKYVETPVGGILEIAEILGDPRLDQGCDVRFDRKRRHKSRAA
jgi:hypothetical protein